MTRRIGTLLLILGFGLLAWSALVYVWKDPFTTVYTAWEQRRLDDRFDQVVQGWQPAAAPARPAGKPPTRRDLRRQARAYRLAAREGEPVARLRIPRLGLRIVVIEGTDTADLRRGPGRHQDSFMPGERELVYIAGHRTTYGAPFASIDSLRAGDRIRLELPYATADYEVTTHRIVDDEDLSVLESRGREELVLQACHPRFFASQRYLVYARLERLTQRGL